MGRGGVGWGIVLTYLHARALSEAPLESDTHDGGGTLAPLGVPPPRRALALGPLPSQAPPARPRSLARSLARPQNGREVGRTSGAKEATFLPALAAAAAVPQEAAYWGGGML